jgi:hypothetical protein
MHTGSGYFRLDAIPAANEALEAGWFGEIYDDSGATPAYAGANMIHFAFHGLDFNIRYVVLIVTD